MGRLFDVDGYAFSIHAFLRACIENIDQFSIDSLREKKQRDSKGEFPEWLKVYLAGAYVPCEKDFQILRGETSKHQRKYEQIYRPIRNKVIAHKEQQTIENVDKLFGKTNIGQIQEFLNFLYQIEHIVFDLLYNGRLSEIGSYKFSEDNFVQKDVEGLLGRVKAP